MGIQDRDYWNDWQREKEGLKPRSDEHSSVPRSNRRRIRIIDKVRVKPAQQDPEPVRIESRDRSYLVGYLLFALCLAGLCWLGFIFYKLMS